MTKPEYALDITHHFVGITEGTGVCGKYPHSPGVDITLIGVPAKSVFLAPFTLG
ncbi:MAG: hypothetical protein JJP05_05930 [cyanobacterium endosymbiont of Rhopalodia gibba]